MRVICQNNFSFEQQACQNLAQLHNTMSPAQRLKAQRKLKDYETDVRELMKI
jgi:hypothetical protein